MQGLNEFVLTMKDGTRLGLPITIANHTRFERIRGAIATAEKRDQTGVEVTALATIHSDSSPQGLILGDAVVLEIYGTANYTVPVSVGPAASSARPIHRIGKP